MSNKDYVEELMEEQKQEFHKIIDDIVNPKMLNYLINLVKSFIKLRS